MLPSFLESQRQRLDLAAYGAAGPLTCLLLTPRFRTSMHVIWLVFPQRGADPVLVAKIPRAPDLATGLDQEAAHLRRLLAVYPQGSESVPRVVTFERIGAYPVLLETALAGQRMDPAYVRRHTQSCCRQVTTWLTALHAASRSACGPEASWYERQVAELLSYLETCCPWTAAERKRWQLTRSLVAPLGRHDLPLVFQHGDLCHPNIFRLRDGRVGVVDWELAQPRGLPLCDLVFFLTYVAYALTGRGNPEQMRRAFHEAFFQQRPWTHRYVQPYLEQLGLPRETLTPLFALCWVRYLYGLARRLASAHAGNGVSPTEVATWLRQNRYYALWSHTLDHHDALRWPTCRPL